MSTYVYGGRDFKGNIVSNAAKQTFADLTALNAFTPPQDGNSGHEVWVVSENKPYWWDTDTDTWITLGGGGSGQFYGMRTIDFTTAFNPPTNPANGYVAGVDMMSSCSVTLIPPAFLSLFPEISTLRPLTVDLSFNFGITFRNPGVGYQAQVFNKIGTANTRTYLTTKLPTALEIPKMRGDWMCGYLQDADTPTLTTVLNPLATTVITPVLLASDNEVTPSYTGEIVDIHRHSFGVGTDNINTINYCDDTITFTEVGRIWLEYNDTAGLVLKATSNSSFAISPAYLAYVDVTDPDPVAPEWLGFDGLPKGNITTYWF